MLGPFVNAEESYIRQEQHSLPGSVMATSIIPLFRILILPDPALIRPDPDPPLIRPDPDPPLIRPYPDLALTVVVR